MLNWQLHALQELSPWAEVPAGEMNSKLAAKRTMRDIVVANWGEPERPTRSTLYYEKTAVGTYYVVHVSLAHSACA